MTPARCASCGERVLERPDPAQRIIVATDPCTGERHGCGSAPFERLAGVTECPHCFTAVARSNFGRMVRWVYPFPAPPYDEHYCAAPSQTTRPQATQEVSVSAPTNGKHEKQAVDQRRRIDP